jgi:hypothetical protein
MARGVSGTRRRLPSVFDSSMPLSLIPVPLPPVTVRTTETSPLRRSMVERSSAAHAGARLRLRIRAEPVAKASLAKRSSCFGEPAGPA